MGVEGGESGMGVEGGGRVEWGANGLNPGKTPWLAICRKSSISPLVGLFMSSPFEGGGGGLDRDGGLFNFEKAMVSVLLKELGYEVEKLQYKKVGGHAAKDQNQIQTSSL